MIANEYLELVRHQFNDRVSFVERRPGIHQFVAPFFHEDGDMYDIFLEGGTSKASSVKITDRGLTLMRLSYTLDLDTENRERIFSQILAEHGVVNDDGNLVLSTSKESLYQGILQFARAVTAITNMRLYRRDVIRSLFYELFSEFTETHLAQFSPEKSFHPIPSRDEYEVDFLIRGNARPIFLFAVKDEMKARLVTISCLTFRKEGIPFKSVIVHENFDALPARDRKIITNEVDKQFTDLDDYRERAVEYFTREVA